MARLPKKESQSQLLALYWGIAVTAPAALITFTFPPEWGICFLVFVGGAALTKAVHMHDWFSAPLKIGKFVRTPVLLALIWGFMGTFGYLVWPKVEITPTELHFHNIIGPGESYPVTLTNKKSHDVFIVSFEIDTGANKSSEFTLHFSEGSLKPLNNITGLKGPLVADVSAVNCPGGNGRITYVTVYRMRPNESRELEFRHDVPGAAEVEFDVYKFFSDPVQKYVTPTGASWEGIPPNRKECTGTARLNWLEMPKQP
jgi:hypothetical protein